MNWVDVAGPPGVGKSSLCDPLWGPHDIAIEDIPPPADWHDFCNEVTRLLSLVQNHWSFIPAVRMNRRSMRKMAAVINTASDKTWMTSPKGEMQLPYIQTGFVQRGLGFGWRLNEMGKSLDELRPFFRLMPVSIGVVFLEADPETIKARNKEREKVKQTAHENRAFMVDLMMPAIEVAKEALDARGVPTITIRTDGDIEEARRQLLDFAGKGPCDAAQAGSGSQASVLSPPAWW